MQRKFEPVTQQMRAHHQRTTERQSQDYCLRLAEPPQHSGRDEKQWRREQIELRPFLRERCIDVRPAACPYSYQAVDDDNKRKEKRDGGRDEHDLHRSLPDRRSLDDSGWHQQRGMADQRQGARGKGARDEVQGSS